MCGIAGICDLKTRVYRNLEHHLEVMNHLIRHRGPDGEGIWESERGDLGLAHRRLSIIDLDAGAQPMSSPYGCTITYNGEIYNYRELKKELADYSFQTSSDTEVILAAYHHWGKGCLSHLRGMFSFALWDEKKQELFIARDRFGIKPLYYMVEGDVLYFASEAKALLPFLPEITTDRKALQDYLTFQFCLEGRTLFEGISELPPAHYLSVRNGLLGVHRYWEVYHKPDFRHTRQYFEEQLREIIEESISLHSRSDVPVGSYISGGIDSSLVASVASRQSGGAGFKGFNGKFTYGEGFDESEYARAVAEMRSIDLYEVDITAQDFLDSIHKVVYHLDFPVAGPGSFSQYQVSKLASQHRKVVLGGQGGDEIFGGYTRYLIAYFEQCIKAAINGTMDSGNFIVTYESIIPNLRSLRNYKPLLTEFWKEGLFEDLDSRYFRLINRSRNMGPEIDWNALGDYNPFSAFKKIFHGDNVEKESYFDMMTHFDFKTLLPSLLHVEDRMSMAHGIESRVPLVDHKVVEFAATMPSDIKFKDGTLKLVLSDSMQNDLPEAVLQRKDKMGFPVPLNEWLQGDLRDFVQDVFRSQSAQKRPYFNTRAILEGIDGEPKFGRKIWGLLSLELWHQTFHDQAAKYRGMLEQPSIPRREARKRRKAEILT